MVMASGVVRGGDGSILAVPPGARQAPWQEPGSGTPQTDPAPSRVGVTNGTFAIPKLRIVLPPD